MDGQADLCYWVPVIELGLMQLNSFAWFPMMGWPSVWAQSEIYPQLLEKFPQLKAEYRGLMVYGFSAITASHISTLKKEVRVPADLKGVKITPATEEIAQMVMARRRRSGQPGGIGLVYLRGEGGHDRIHQCLRRPDGLQGHGAVEVPCSRGTRGLSMNPHFLLINPDNWKKIPPDIQTTPGSAHHTPMGGARVRCRALTRRRASCRIARRQFLMNRTPRPLLLHSITKIL